MGRCSRKDQRSVLQMVGGVIHTVGVNIAKTHYKCVANKPTATSVILLSTTQQLRVHPVSAS